MDTTKRRRSFSITRLIRYGWLGLCMLLIVACHQDMYQQPKYRPLDPSEFFADGRASRKAVPGAVIAGQVRTDEYFFTGFVNGQEGTDMPFPVTGPDGLRILERGREKYTIYCAPCHGDTGNGQGMVAQRGAIVASNFHDQRLIDAPVGHFFNVITNGYRYMYPYASRIEPADRWAIVAYIRALQLSQNATINDVPPDRRADLERQP